MRAKNHANFPYALIVTCPPSKTFAAMDYLENQGLEVWTPIERKKIRLPRSKVTRETTLPVLRGHVFVTHGQPDFSARVVAGIGKMAVMTSHSAPVRVPLSDVAEFKARVERIGEEKDGETDAPIYYIGDEVSFTDPIFRGIDGVVIGTENDILTIEDKKTSKEIKISSSFVEPKQP